MRRLESQVKPPPSYLEYKHELAELRVYGKQALAELPDSRTHPVNHKEGGAQFSGCLVYKQEKEFLSRCTGIEPSNIFFLKQRHGNNICYVQKEGENRGQGKQERLEQFYYAVGDALYTQERGIVLVVRTADCLPFFVIMESRHKSLFGLIHAGWRGLKQKIVYASLGQMLERFLGSQKKNDSEELGTLHIHCFCGPCAGASRYAVSLEVAQLFSYESLRKDYPQEMIETILSIPAPKTREGTCEKEDKRRKREEPFLAYKKIASERYLLDLLFLAKLQMKLALKGYAQLKDLKFESLLRRLRYHETLEGCTLGQNEELFSHRCGDKGRNLNLIKIL